MGRKRFSNPDKPKHGPGRKARKQKDPIFLESASGKALFSHINILLIIRVRAIVRMATAYIIIILFCNLSFLR